MMAFYDNVEFINNQCTQEDLLDQLMEECGELIKACVKLKRAHKGTTPITKAQAMQMFIEEMADVSVAQAVAMRGIMCTEDVEHMFSIERDKAQRWQERIEKGVLNT